MTTVDNPKVSQTSGKDEDPNEKGFFNRPRAGGKTMWDWLDLIAKLAIPIVVVFATIAFGWWQVHLTDVQHQQDQQSSLDQQEATLLQAYLDNAQDLMLNHQLATKPTIEVRELARARTMATLKSLDPYRKGSLLIFLYEANLIEKGNAKIDLLLADFGGAKITGNDLHAADLHGISLKNADLRFVDLSDTDLSFADFRGADLLGANLRGANLTGNQITQQQLDQVDTCEGATLTQGETCHQFGFQ